MFNSFELAVRHHNQAESATLRLIVGVKVSEKSGVESPVYASCKVPGTGLYDVPLTLARLSRLPIASVTTPATDKWVTLTVKIPKRVNGAILAVLFVYFGTAKRSDGKISNHDECVSTVKTALPNLSQATIDNAIGITPEPVTPEPVTPPAPSSKGSKKPVTA